FREIIRVSPAALTPLISSWNLESIRHDEVFYCGPAKLQIDIHVQLAILMYRLGHCGNAAGEIQVASIFGLGVGTVVKCTNRVLQAVLCWDRIKSAVRCPAARESREASKNEAAQRSIPEWRGDWYALDGTTVPLVE
ncbi:hypothetical protein V8E36_007689, partial [Tilletia maclaganii]